MLGSRIAITKPQRGQLTAAGFEVAVTYQGSPGADAATVSTDSIGRMP
jgi:hypothetical protein